ncbi:hypothetical protein Sste5344_002914 [Sporothrix stenoceras]
MISQEQFAFPFVDDYNVTDSSFARTGFDKLPTPDQVRLRSLKHEPRHTGLSKAFLRPSVLYYQSLGMAVKYGHHVSISEAHCLLFLRKHSPEVPVPEVYAWRRNHRQTFIYMELIDAAGPFSSVTEFHDWLATDDGRSKTMATGLCNFKSGTTTTETDAKYRAKLDDNVPVVLTHGQLNPVNILVGYPDGDKSGSPQIMAIIDWSMAGWMPLHWEDCEGENDEGHSTSVAFEAEDGTKATAEGDSTANPETEEEYRDAVRYFTLGAAP